MDIYTKVEHFRKRWNVKDSDSADESFDKFKTRILNVLSNIDHNINDEDIELFCNILGIQVVWEYDSFSGETYSSNIVQAIERAENYLELYELIEIVFGLNIVPRSTGPTGVVFSKKILFKKLWAVFRLSNIDARLVERDGEFFVVPSGEQMLDEGVVNHVLTFLKDHALSHFVSALRGYIAGANEDRVKSLEGLRRSLEELLRMKLGNRKGLKANIAITGKKLKELEVNSGVKNITTQIMSSLDQFFNEYSKHGDGEISEEENEYLIYQVALLMRYLHRIL